MQQVARQQHCAGIEVCGESDHDSLATVVGLDVMLRGPVLLGQKPELFCADGLRMDG